ncbi:MAG: hypothetical protein HY645_14910 [Acidobacteria bacterium]|nr:hypothetical protein [Acidobacteriota bacterium]
MSEKNRLIVANGGWAETIPQWLLDAVKEERLTLGMVGVMKPLREVGDAEACAYLYTASLTAPMPHNLSQIYFWLGAKLMKRRGMQLPDFMAEKLGAGLTADEERELAELKRELFRKRGEISHPLLDALRELKRGPGRKRPVSALAEKEVA